MLRFSTAGPCRPGDNYMIPPLERLPEAPGLVEQEAYFVIHAPRQTGKTTVIRALAESLTESGRYAALAFTCETGRAAADDYPAAQRALLDQIRGRGTSALPADLRPPAWPDASESGLLQAGLAAWARACPRPLVLLFDEIDALAGQSLVSVLSQLRAGYNERPHGFPASVVLCGLRDVRDYQAASGGDPTRLGSPSPFNVLVESLRVGDFAREDVARLYGQHTSATGQEFTHGAVEYAHEVSGGQPWLVNALAREVVEKIGVPPTDPIGQADFELAKERLIQARATHLDSLVARLHEPRVRKVIEPLITGELAIADETYNDDVAYLRDLGLIAPRPPITIANPIYREVILRVLGARVEENVVADPRSFVLPDGRLDFDKLLQEFADFWKQHGEILISGSAYHEAAPHLVIMAFLHRIVNGGGHVDREYGVGRGRIDLVVRWPYQDADGNRRCQRQAMELKVWRSGRPDPLTEGLRQLDDYLDRLGLDQGVLVIFDRRTDAGPTPDRTRFTTDQTPSGRPVTLLRA